MQQWEYLTARVTGAGGGYRWKDTSGRSEHLESMAEPISILNQLGSEGWELVSVGFTDHQMPRSYLFKRPKQ
jgi:hypothetical protein